MANATPLKITTTGTHAQFSATDTVPAANLGAHASTHAPNGTDPIPANYSPMFLLGGM